MKKFGVFLICLIVVFTTALFSACGGEKYTVTFVTSGGTEIESYSLSEGATVKQPADPEKDMFTFDGWYADASLETPYSFPGKMPAEDLYIYAKWTGEKSVKITYDSQGGSAVEASIGLVGETFKAPQSPTYSCYDFGGWYTEAECVNAYEFTVYPEESITLYAKWNENSGYAYVSFYGNGAFLRVTPVSKSATFNEPNDIFESYEANTGWYSDEEMTQSYSFGETLSANLSLYTTYYTVGLTFSGNTVTGYYGDSSDITVPSKYNGKVITTIGANAFIDTIHTESVVKTVNLPETVTTISEGAFKDCSYLTTINLSSSVTSLGANAFANDLRLESVGDLTSVTEIPESAFLGCASLYSITLSDNLTSIGANAFKDCSGLKEIVISSKVTSIGEYAFSRCTALATVTIGSSSAGGNLTAVGAYAFANCTALKTVTIYSSSVPVLTMVNTVYGPFYGCTDSDLAIYVPSAHRASYESSYGTMWISNDGSVTFKSVLKSL